MNWERLLKMLKSDKSSTFLLGKSPHFFKISRVFTTKGVQFKHFTEINQAIIDSCGDNDVDTIIIFATREAKKLQTLAKGIKIAINVVFLKKLTEKPFKFSTTETIIRSSLLIGKFFYLFGESLQSARLIKQHLGSIAEDVDGSEVVFCNRVCDMNAEKCLQVLSLKASKGAKFRGEAWLQLLEDYDDSFVISNKDTYDALPMEGFGMFLVNAAMLSRADMQIAKAMGSNFLLDPQDGCVIIQDNTLQLTHPFKQVCSMVDAVHVDKNWIVEVIRKKNVGSVGNYLLDSIKAPRYAAGFSIEDLPIALHSGLADGDNVKKNIEYLGGRMVTSLQTLQVCPNVLAAGDVVTGDLLTTTCLNRFAQELLPHVCKYYCTPLKKKPEFVGLLKGREIFFSEKVDSQESEYIRGIMCVLGGRVVEDLTRDAIVFVTDCDDNMCLEQSRYYTTYFADLVVNCRVPDLEHHNVDTCSSELCIKIPNESQWVRPTQRTLTLEPKSLSSIPTTPLPTGNFTNSVPLVATLAPKSTRSVHGNEEMIVNDKLMTILMQIGVFTGKFIHVADGGHKVDYAQTLASVDFPFGFGLVQFYDTAVNIDNKEVICELVYKATGEQDLAKWTRDLMEMLSYMLRKLSVDAAFSDECNGENVKIYSTLESETGRGTLEIYSVVVGAITRVEKNGVSMQLYKRVTESIQHDNLENLLVHVVMYCKDHETMLCCCENIRRRIQRWKIIRARVTTRDPGANTFPVLVELTRGRVLCHANHKKEWLAGIEEDVFVDIFKSMEKPIKSVPVTCSTCSSVARVGRLVQLQKGRQCALCREQQANAILTCICEVSTTGEIKAGGPSELDFSKECLTILKGNNRVELEPTANWVQLVNIIKNDVGIFDFNVGNWELSYHDQLGRLIAISLKLPVQQNFYLCCKRVGCFRFVNWENVEDFCSLHG